MIQERISNLNSVNISIKIGDESCDFDTIKLHQSMSSHHTFEIKVNFKHNKTSVWTLSPNEIFKQLGEEISIKMKHSISGEENSFYGYISDINIGGKEGNQDYVILRGGSPTLLLDRDPSMGCFVDYTLQNIISEILNQSGIKINSINKPKYQSIIPYTCRYKESSWGFLSRVLRSYGEWFYYNGKELVVGKPSNNNQINARYDIELKSIDIASKVQPLNIEQYDYNAECNIKYNDTPQKNETRENDYMRIAKSKSTPFYPKVQILPTTHPISEDEDAVNTINSLHNHHYAGMSIYTATSNTCAIRLGEWIEITIPKSFNEVKFTNLGSMRVTEITHEIDNNGKYINTFKGIAGESTTIPNSPHISTPIALPEVATVIDNNDPLHQGRVKVQYMWQDSANPNDTSNWIRVQTPDGGKSDSVTKGRGFLFIPEIEDQVMIGFEYGDPSRPFVMGSLFHAENALEAAQENGIKRITTRLGSTLTFNDQDYTIKLKTSKGNQILINEIDGIIEIESQNELNITSKEINIESTENININTKKDFNITVGGVANINITGNVNSKTDGDYNLDIAKTLTLHSNSDTLMSTDGKMVIASQNKMNLKSKTKVDIAKG